MSDRETKVKTSFNAIQAQTNTNSTNTLSASLRGSQENEARYVGIRYKIARFHPEDWSRLEDELMKLETACYYPGKDSPIVFDKELKQELMTQPRAITLLAYDKRTGRVVGEAYGGPLVNEIAELEDREHSAFGELFARYRGKVDKVFYQDAYGVLPEYRNKGVGSALKLASLAAAKREGYEMFVGHTKQGEALKINIKFGAQHIIPHPNWFDSGNTHYSYEINLNKMRVKLPVPIVTQTNDYNCGPASLQAVLGYYGTQADQEKLEKLSGTTEKDGTSHEGLIAAAESFGMQHFSKKDTSTIEDIRQKIEESIPVIVNYQTYSAPPELRPQLSRLPKFMRGQFTEGHYSVVSGYEEDRLIINDVETGKEVKIPNSEFEGDWYSRRYGKKWMLAIFPKTAENAVEMKQQLRSE